MRDLTLFETIVQPSVERIPLMDVRFKVTIDGRPCVISNVIERNVFTDFDIKLSRHMAAVRGGGFPSISVSQRMRLDDPMAPWSGSRQQHFLTVPHALRAVARRALDEREKSTLYFADVTGPIERAEEDLPTRDIEKTEIKTFGTALEFCRTLGAFEFLDLSGDFDMLIVQPAGTEMQPITVDLFRGMVAVPGTVSGKSEGFVGALYELRRNTQSNEVARSYYATARHAMTSAKQDAVLDFRAAAETKIHAFDRALAGRPIAGHRLDAAMSLVARLRTGLGETLHGISEDARITALDWADAVERGGDAFDDAAGDAGHAGSGDTANSRRRPDLFEWRAATAAG
ncbi:MAG: hypothetical protein AAF899_05515 [Pseudomonadota bacterium]